ELIGVVSNHDESKPRRWWRPDGSEMDVEPYAGPSTVSNQRQAYEFTLRLPEGAGYGCRAIAPEGKHAMDDFIPYANRKPLPELRSLILSPFQPEERETSFSVDLATGEWQTVENWRE